MKFLKDLKSVLNLTVIVAGLGYFVDLFDITVYGVVRTASLTDIGVSQDQLFSAGVFIYNCQMFGMMVGGLAWGMLADKRGRLSVMFGSILLYSLANFANIFVWDVNSYAFVRFLGGVGLAGELGAAVTLVAESLPKEKRGLGTTIVATLGMLGIAAAAFAGKVLSWKQLYLLGGVMGVMLLFARFKIAESTLFHATSSKDRGNLRQLLTGKRLKKYLYCIVIGVPVYFTTGVFFTFAPEVAADLGVKEAVSAADAILYGSFGLALGDLLSGLLSHQLKSRKKAIALSLTTGLALAVIYGLSSGLTTTVVYVFTFAIGLTVGYWAVMITVAAEQFGTNLRGTAATSVPNFVRGSAILPVTSYGWLKTQIAPSYAAISVAAVCFGLALLALTQLDETFDRDLDYNET